MANSTNIECALQSLIGDHVQNNKFRMGTLGSSDIDMAVALLLKEVSDREQSVAQEPLSGEWRYGNGYLSCGTLRISREDMDTEPSAEYREEIFNWICDKLNK